MILSDISTYLADHKRVALRELANHFNTDPQALRGMLHVLERKGRVSVLTPKPACGGSCNACDPTDVEIYEWTGK